MNTKNYTEINSKAIDKWVDGGWVWGTPISHEEYLKAQNGNEIFTSYETIRYNESITAGFQVHASYHLISPEHLAGFEADVRAISE